MIDWRRISRVAPLIGVVIFLSACATTPPLPRTDLPVLVDPRLGFDGPSSDRVDRQFAAAWQKLVAGEVAAADKAFTSLATKHPKYAPATLGRAVVALARDQVDQAGRHVENVANPGSSYIAAEAYRAEIARERGLTEDAYRNYKRIARLPGAPTIVTTRFEVVADEWFEELVARAGTGGSESDRIALLTEAVAVRPGADATRIDLAKLLADVENWTRARAEVEVLMDRGLADNPDVQALLADLEASEGRYQEAIVRLERLVNRYPGRGHEITLAEVKTAYMMANLPPRYHRAVASEAITRADLAILAYWHVSAVRFTSVSASPIAVDLAGVAGRNEIVKILSLGLLSVDPATRTFDPDATVSSRALVSFAARAMRLAPALPCANGHAGAEALAACGIDLTRFADNPSGLVSGRVAVEVLTAINDLFASAK